MALVEPPDLSALRLRSRGRGRALPIVSGQAISLVGDYIAYVTLPLFVLHLTGRSLELGLTAAAETLPTLLFGFMAGVVLDRIRIRPILIGSDLIRAIAFVLLAVGAASDSAAPWMVFLTAFVIGSFATFFNTGLEAILPRIIPRDELVVVNSRLALARTVAFTIGPAIGGILVSLGGGFPTAFLVNAGTFVVSAMLLATVRVRARIGRRVAAGFAPSLREGLRFLLVEPTLRWVTLGAAVVNLVFAPLEALLFLYIPTSLGAEFSPPDFLNFLFSDQALVGIFIALQAATGSLLLFAGPRIARRMPLGRMAILGLTLFGSGYLVMVLMGSFWGFIPAGFGIAGVGFANIAIVTLRQQKAPAEILGRVVAASRTISWSLIPVGAALGGYLADQIGLVTIYIIGSAGVLVTAAFLSQTALWASSDEAPAR